MQVPEQGSTAQAQAGSWQVGSWEPMKCLHLREGDSLFTWLFLAIAIDIFLRDSINGSHSSQPPCHRTV